MTHDEELLKRSETDLALHLLKVMNGRNVSTLLKVAAVISDVSEKSEHVVYNTPTTRNAVVMHPGYKCDFSTGYKTVEIKNRNIPRNGWSTKNP